MRLSGYQPHYFPRLHYFARILNSDVFEISDYLQFVPKHAFITAAGDNKRGKSYQAHTIIKLNTGAFFMAVPTKKGQQPINQTQIDYAQPWIKNHLGTITAAYGRSPRFKEIFTEIKIILEKPYTSLADLTITTIAWGILKILNGVVSPEQCTIAHVNKRLSMPHPYRLQKIVTMSETTIKPPTDEKDANDWIIEICKTFNCTEYYFGGTSAAAYMDFAKFNNAAITLVQQNWQCPTYRQQFANNGFIPNLSIIDLLMHLETSRLASVFAP